MSLTKDQCKEILKQAKKADACSSNYEPAKKAYKKSDYETFEKICRGNISWLVGCGIEFPASVSGEYIYYYRSSKLKGLLNEYGEPSDIIFRIDKDSEVVDEIEVKDSLGVTYYKVEKQRDFNLQESNEYLKMLADAIYKHLGNSITVTNV